MARALQSGRRTVEFEIAHDHVLGSLDSERSGLGRKSRMHVHVVADSLDSDPGFVGARLVDKHQAYLTHRDRDDLQSGDALEADLVLLLGSARSAHAAAESSVVEAESELVRAALASGIPVLGICYGAQLLARALGGEVHPSAQPEIGWYRLNSEDPLLCPAGPWTQFHSDALIPPSTARVLGTSPAGCQGFADEAHRARALGWQFHPEVTPSRFITWVERLRPFCESHGADPDWLIATAAERETGLRQAAYSLTDVAISWLREPPGTPTTPDSQRQQHRASGNEE